MTEFEYKNLSAATAELGSLLDQLDITIGSLHKAKTGPPRQLLIEFISERCLTIAYESELTDTIISVYGTRDEANQLVNLMYNQGHQMAKYELDPVSGSFKIYDGQVQMLNMIKVPRKAHLMNIEFETATGSIDNVSRKFRRESLVQAKVRYYDIYSNPVLKASQWIDTLQRDKFFPTAPPKLMQMYRTRDDRGRDKMFKLIDVITSDKQFKKSTVLVGSIATEYILSEYNDNLITDIGDYIGSTKILELASNEPEQLIAFIKQYYSKDSTDSTVTSKTNVNVIGSSRIIKYSLDLGTSRLCEIYDAGQDCIPYNTTDDNLKIGTVHLILKYMYTGLWVADKIGNESLSVRLINMIWLLYNCWLVYVRQSNDILSKNAGLNRVFNVQCTGRQRMPITEIKKRKFHGERASIVQRYNPYQINYKRMAKQNKK